MEDIKRIAGAFSEGRKWGAYVAARTAMELAARAVVELGLTKPRRCEELPGVLALAGVLSAEQAERLAEVIKAAKSMHRRDDIDVDKIGKEALELSQTLLKSLKRRYPPIETREGLRYALKSAGVTAAYSLGLNAIAVRAARPLSLEDRSRLAVDLASELGVPPERVSVLDMSEPSVEERAVFEGRLIYADDLDEEIERLIKRYQELCC